MSVMMPPDPTAAQGLPVPPGGGGAGPLDALNQGPLPSDGGMAGLLAALGGGGDGGPGGPAGGPPDDTGNPNDSMTSVEHIQEAMKHLMMAMAKEPDEAHGVGITKGMGALQGILAGKQKEDQQRQSLGAGPGGP